MRKLTILAIMLCAITTLKAQSPFTTYTPVVVDPRTGYPIPPTTQATEQENFQTVNAYFINSRGRFQKIRIKINVVSGVFGSEEVYVRAYKSLTYNSWTEMNSMATAITQSSYVPDIIKENFDWKCYILNIGTIYF